MTAEPTQLYMWDDVEAALAIGVAAFATAYLTDGLALGILSGLIFFLISLACFEAARSVGTSSSPQLPTTRSDARSRYYPPPKLVRFSA